MSKGEKMDSFIAADCEVNFYDSDRASVFWEDSTNDELTLWSETSLVVFFAVRSLFNMGEKNDPQSLAEFLIMLSLDWEAYLELDPKESDQPALVAAQGVGRKRFESAIRLGDRMSFKLKPRGFGIFLKGIGYYYPTAVQLLFRHFAERHADDRARIQVMADAGALVAQMWVAGRISIAKQNTPSFEAVIAVAGVPPGF